MKKFNSTKRRETQECKNPLRSVSWWFVAVRPACSLGLFSERVSYMSVISALPMSPTPAWKCCQYCSTYGAQ